MAEIQIGTLVNNKYRIDSVLGEGGMGTVFKAKEVGLDRLVALKVPKPAVVKNKDFMARFGREAKLVAKLNHDNIVQVFEFYNHPDLVFMALEFVQGVELGDIAKRPPVDMTVKDILDIMSRSCEGVAYAHDQGIIHRDIKPANIMVARSSRGVYRVKMMDFGIAHVGEGELFTQQLTELTQAGSAMGTPSYMSPEQVEGRKVMPSSDVYSMACVYYFVFTLKNLFEGSLFNIISQHVNAEPPDPSATNPNLPPELYEVLKKGLAKKPEDRYQSCRDLAKAVWGALESHKEKTYREFLPPGAVDDADPINLEAMALSIGPGEEETKAAGGANDGLTVPADGDGSGASSVPPPTISGMPAAGGHDSTGALTPELASGATIPSVGGSGMQSPFAGAQGDSGTFDATAIYNPAADATMMHAPSKGGAGKFIIIFLVLGVIGVGAFFALGGGGDPMAAFNQSLSAGQYGAARAAYQDFSPDLKDQANALILQDINSGFQAAVRAFETKQEQQLIAQLSSSLQLAREMNNAGVPGVGTILEKLEKLDQASSALTRYNQLYEQYAARAANREQVRNFQNQASSMLAQVDGLVSANFRQTINEDVRALEGLISASSGQPGVASTPTPTPTPSRASQASATYRNLLNDMDDPNIPPADMLEEMRRFVSRFPDFEHVGEAQNFITQLEREVTLTPDMVEINRKLTFTMGSDDGLDDEKPPHPVELSPYAVSKFEVSTLAYTIFLNEVGNPNESYYQPGADAVTIEKRGNRFIPKQGADRLPVNWVTWHGAKAYAKWLSEQLGRNFDLPTEAEWERAAQGSVNDIRRYPWGNNINQNMAVYGQLLPDNPPTFTVMQPVQSKPDGVTDEGVYHMAGNVAEWTNDWYARNYESGRQVNPKGPADGRQRVVRGGSWETERREDLRIRARERENPDYGYINIGFRLVERP
jgi:formylglycine-generating enzyme required for sulfatase activity/tRNA A-37 threonylcarbamoyl transferase component Bud32